MLRPAANGRQHFLRVRGGEHEDDVVGRLLQRLQQCVRGGLREHVDLVDDVDLPPSRRRQRRPGNEVPHGVDAVVGRRVQLVDVEGSAPGDVQARVARSARLPLDGTRAVQRLRKDPRGRGLSGAPGAGEEVGVCDAVVPNRVAEGVHHVVLTLGPRQSAAADNAGTATDSRPRSGAYDLSSDGIAAAGREPDSSIDGPSASIAGKTRAGTGVSSTSELVVRSIPRTSRIRSRTSAR